MIKKLFFFAALLFLLSCSFKPYRLLDEYIYLQKPKRQTRDWKLVWAEEFESHTLDTTYWSKIPPNTAD